jgi:hypothetical protein
VIIGPNIFSSSSKANIYIKEGQIVILIESSNIAYPSEILYLIAIYLPKKIKDVSVGTP